MKLVAEQIKYLRARKRELEGKAEEYRRYCQTRESAGLDGFGGPHFLDYQEQMERSYSSHELRDVDRQLANGEFVTERNFDFIDIGTGFYATFGDGEKERTVLIDEGTTYTGDSIYASTASDFGKAVFGKKSGDTVQYTVQANGRKMTVTIEEIDTMKEHYAHFIREKELTDRMSDPVKKELAELKKTDPEEYRRRQAITPSQEKLLKQELTKIGYRPRTASLISRKAAIEKTLRDCPIAALPTGDKVQVGPIVGITLMDENQQMRDYQFEMINKAVSTEIEGEYVERVSTLGQAIYGLKRGSNFSVKRKNKPSLKGVVTSVENFKENERVR